MKRAYILLYPMCIAPRELNGARLYTYPSLEAARQFLDMGNPYYRIASILYRGPLVGKSYIESSGTRIKYGLLSVELATIVLEKIYE